MNLSLAPLAAIVIGTVVTTASAAVVSPYIGNAFSHFADNALDAASRGVIVEGSGNDDDHHQYQKDDRGSDDADASEDDDDDGDGANANPAPAGTVAPPANGLFGKGPAPRVQVH
jgi:hypothetical protein